MRTGKPLAFALLATTAALALPASADTTPSDVSSSIPTQAQLEQHNPSFHDGVMRDHRFVKISDKTKALLALHDEGVRLRQQDGGTLTEEHRAYLQGKLDTIQAQVWPANSEDGRIHCPPAQSDVQCGR